MLDSPRIMQLYDNVLTTDMHRFNIPVDNIKDGIETMTEVYRPNSGGLSSDEYTLANYNDAAHRCAYLHKYAAFHTAMVRDMMYEAARMNYRFFYDIVYSRDRFNICCLGGGPGTDVIGVLAALHTVFSFFETSVTIVDYMVNWSHSFQSILRELGSGYYGAFGNNAYHFLNWRYVGANLLKPLLPDVLHALGSASLVTMIKFASAAACVDTEIMVQNIFSAMKPGAVLLFIDNDGGGFHELMRKVATQQNFLSIFGPIRHENYQNDAMRIKRFGVTSCFKSTVTVHILQKPPLMPLPYSSPNDYRGPIWDEVPVNYLTSSDFLGRFDFTVDENIRNVNEFRSPEPEIPQSPSLLPLPSCISTPLSSNMINSPVASGYPVPAFTPVSKSKGRKRKKMSPGCFPLRNLRQNIARKFHQVKYRASSLLRRHPKAQKKTHPVFRL